MEGMDGRRRHRPDWPAGGRKALRDQSRGRLEWPRARPDKTVNPNAMKSLAKNTIFTNVAAQPDGGAWWGGHDGHTAGRADGLAGNCDAAIAKE